MIIGKPLENHKYEIKRILASILLVVGMFALVSLIGNNEMIFPEIAALAVGAWIMPQLPWEGRTINLWLSPTLAALTGILILKIIPFNTFLMIALAFVLVIIQLQLMCSGVFPAISAAILPILVHSDSWLYPASVCMLTGIIYIGNSLVKGTNPGQAVEKASLGSHSRKRYWLRILISVLAVAGTAVYFDLMYILAPPLIVVFVELTQPNSPLKTRRWKVFLLIMLSAFSGVIWLSLVKYHLHLPLWVSGTFALTGVIFLYRWLDIRFPPAAALALLPSVIPAGEIWFYPFEVSLGCGVFILFSVFFERINFLQDFQREGI